MTDTNPFAAVDFTRAIDALSEAIENGDKFLRIYDEEGYPLLVLAHAQTTPTGAVGWIA